MPAYEDAVSDPTAIHRALAASRARLAAHDEAVVRTQIAVAQIGAPTGEESERAGWMARRFRDCALEDVHVDDAGNVIGRRGGRADLPPVVVCAHLDTVFPRETALGVRREHDRLIGPGINDNARGLAVMLALAGEIDGARLVPLHPIEFVATTGEEGAGDLRGAKHYFSGRGRGAFAAVALDGAGDDRIIHRALGSRRFKISYEGPGGHSWAAFGVPNAVHAAGVAAAALAAHPLPREPRATLSIGRIGGGLSVNSIPDAAWLEVDTRSSDAGELDRMERVVRDSARRGADTENGRRAFGARALTTRIETIGSRPCGETPSDHPVVQAAIVATRLIGREAELALASTDANVPISHGIPAIAIGGGGRGGDAHSRTEWYDNVHGAVGIGRALTILLSVAGLAED